MHATHLDRLLERLPSTMGLVGDMWLPSREIWVPVHVPPRSGESADPQIIQQAPIVTNGGTNPGPAPTFASAITPGNLLLSQFAHSGTGATVQYVGNAVTQIGSIQKAHASFGSWCEIFYRKLVAGDGTQYGYNQNGFGAVRNVEITGLDMGSSPANLTQAGGIASASVSIAMGGSSDVWAFASVVTRLETAANSAITLNGASTAIVNNGDFIHPNNGIGGAIILYGRGNATLGGTQTGTTRDGFNYGYTAFTWAPYVAGRRSQGVVIG